MMLPLILLICGVVFLGIGAWPVALLCFGGALLGNFADNDVEEKTKAAEAMGQDQSAGRAMDSVFNMGCGLAFLLTALAVGAAALGLWNP